ncbi:MAG: hypothetical protein KBF97_08435 [Bacteroidetes bacterium]|nr:hypothetical protein [Bacteroidota bacterium]
MKKSIVVVLLFTMAMFAAGCASEKMLDKESAGPILLYDVEALLPYGVTQSKPVEVMVKLLVDVRGRVSRASVESETDIVTANAALDAAMRRRYIPAKVERKKTAVWVMAPIVVKSR